jgi:hypothetical protein
MKMKIGLLFLFVLFSGFSPTFPKVLIIGDSISIGYFSFVENELNKKATLCHKPGNAQHTGTGLKNIKSWIESEHWDIIQSNRGLWDLSRIHKGSLKSGHQPKEFATAIYSPEEYGKNLDSLVCILESTNAKLIFVTTTYVPKNEPYRFSADVKTYNRIAKQIMKKHHVQVNDIYSASRKIHNQWGTSPDDVHFKNPRYKELSKSISSFLLHTMEELNHTPKNSD